MLVIAWAVKWLRGAWNAGCGDTGIIEEAGVNVLTLTEGLAEEEFLSSRLTRAEVARQLGAMTGVALKLSEQTRSQLPELDWDGWEGAARQLGEGGSASDEALWFAVKSLVPATLMWLRVYRKNMPEIFACKPSGALES